MTKSDDRTGFSPCDAGRPTERGTIIDFQGRWTEPCETPGRHVIAFSREPGGAMAPEAPILRFCDVHAQQLIDAGIIDEIAVDALEWKRRVEEGRAER